MVIRVLKYVLSAVVSQVITAAMQILPDVLEAALKKLKEKQQKESTDSKELSNE